MNIATHPHVPDYSDDDQFLTDYGCWIFANDRKDYFLRNHYKGSFKKLALSFGFVRKRVKQGKKFFFRLRKKAE